MKVKQVITYTNGRQTVRYFNSIKESQQSYSITMLSPVVESIEPYILSDEEFKKEQEK